MRLRERAKAEASGGRAAASGESRPNMACGLGFVSAAMRMRGEIVRAGSPAWSAEALAGSG